MNEEPGVLAFLRSADRGACVLLGVCIGVGIAGSLRMGMLIDWLRKRRWEIPLLVWRFKRRQRK